MAGPFPLFSHYPHPASPCPAQVRVKGQGQVIMSPLAFAELMTLRASLQWGLSQPGYSHATDEEAARRSEDTYPRSHSWNVSEMGWKPGRQAPCLPSWTLSSFPLLCEASSNLGCQLPEHQ